MPAAIEQPDAQPSAPPNGPEEAALTAAPLTHAPLTHAAHAKAPFGRKTIAAAFSVSRSLQILAFVVFAVVLGVTYNQLTELRSATLDDAHRQMTRLDMVLAEHTGRAMETVSFLLRNVTDPGGISAHGAAWQADPTAARDGLRRRISGVRQLLALEVADTEGHILISTRAMPGETLPAIGLSLLQRHVADPALGLQLSEPLRLEDGSWTTLATLRVDGPNKNFEGIVVAYINLPYFEDFYKAVDLPENGAIILHRRDGLILASYPHDDMAYGRSYADLPPFRDILSRGIAGTVVMDSPRDSSRRILAIRALRTVPLAVGVSVDEHAVLAGWRRQTTVLTGASIGIALAIGGLMLLLAHRSREMQSLLATSVQARGEAEAANTRMAVQMEERARAEAALLHSQRVEAVGQLTGGVAHDFNNLLTILLGNIELMQSQPATAVVTQRLSTMRAAAERGARLTHDLLAFARRRAPTADDVDLGALLRGMQPLLASAMGTKIDLALDIDDATPPVHVDAAQIELVVLNLAINARNAMPLGGTLRIATRFVLLADGGAPNSAPNSAPDSAPDSAPAGRYVSLRMSDSGAGMSPEVLRRAFDPYFTTKAPGDGSGLGLSQVYGIVRQAGGQVRIDSVQNQGTTVEVHLPCQAPATQPEIPHTGMSHTGMPPAGMPPAGIRPAGIHPAGAMVQPPRGTLLVVDDDHAVRATTAMLLRRAGYNVTEADGGETALAILAHDGSIELMLSDVVMPTMNGTEVARRAATLRPNLPVLFVSGYADPQAIAGAIPASRLVRKPFRPADLIRMIERTLTEARV